jgi:hypothetical protein
MTMTEREWFVVVAPESMLAWIGPRCPERKLRLYAAAVGRRTARGKRLLGVLDEAEAAVDRGQPPSTSEPELTGGFASRHETNIARALTARDPLAAARQVSAYAIAAAEAVGKAWEERWFQAVYLCDIVGNPFRPVPFSSDWRTDTVLSLARTMYESREFSAMPILADALQDAGCDSTDILNHCRDTTQPHVRGCWVTDLVLGKQ